MTCLKTPRLLLRPWKESDLKPFAALNQDPRVMEYFPSTLTEKESKKLMHRFLEKFKKNGWGFWACSVPGICDYIGFIGLNPIEAAQMPLPFAPAVEIGWRLAYDFWGKGYAFEGAAASLQYGFETLKLPEIISFTSTQNIRSQKLMQRLGLKHSSKDDFERPKLPEGHPLRRHVLYKMSSSEWIQTKDSLLGG